MVDWDTNESALLINPAYSNEDQLRFRQVLEQGTAWPGHIWLATSGSCAPKWVGLSKQALLASAQAVNDHLHSHASDRWALALPEFHVGGLSIRARAYLSGAEVSDFKQAHPGKWCARTFYDYLEQMQATLTALVPSQLYDLLLLEGKAPPQLRALVIGGGQLVPDLYHRAIESGWNVLPSYGLSECASQVATAALDNSDPSLKVLPHVSVRLHEGRLAFKGPSLLSVYAYCEEGCRVRFVDPKMDGWFVTEDRGEVAEGILTVFGRMDQVIKIGGENVDLARLEAILQSLRLQQEVDNEMLLLAMPHERLGQVIHLVLVGEKKIETENAIVLPFNERVLPFERIRSVHWVAEIPKSPLSKILRSELQKLITQKS
ncbi:MAG: AMP-binding protein [Chlamydiales bacterium]